MVTPMRGGDIIGSGRVGNCYCCRRRMNVADIGGWLDLISRVFGERDEEERGKRKEKMSDCATH